jgi:ubiquinone/menaquinone biosynthesis C-methylase UbiE
MPIGAEQRYLPSRCHSGLRSLLKPLYPTAYFCVYGTEDLHTHIRWRAIKPFVSSACRTGAEVILDVGCGYGSISFEVAQRLNTGKVVGIDIDPERIGAAKEIRKSIRVTNVDFQISGVSGLSEVPDNFCDVVLMIDVIEHIVDDKSVVREVGRILKPGGALIISTPTPMYPRVFGLEFHNEVGHVRDGYSIERLKELLAERQMNIERYEYYTYPASALVCFPFYRWIRKFRYAGILASPVLNLFSYLDYLWPIREPRAACSIGLLSRKGVA